MTFIVSISSFESTTLESVTVKSTNSFVSRLTSLSSPSTSCESVMLKSISSLLLSASSAILESVIVKSTKGSVSLLTSASFPSTSQYHHLLKSISSSISFSVSREVGTFKYSDGLGITSSIIFFDVSAIDRGSLLS